MRMKMSKKNRLANCHNKFQGEAKRVLCICSAGLLHSPTAAVVLQREFGYNTRAAGLDGEYALIMVDDVLLDWADEIVVMESWMAHELNHVPTPIVCLGIEDDFNYMDTRLQQVIKEQYMEKTSK